MNVIAHIIPVVLQDPLYKMGAPLSLLAKAAWKSLTSVRPLVLGEDHVLGFCLRLLA